jgi:hypothetical protein
MQVEGRNNKFDGVGGMKKGFIFSLDAALAVTMVVAVGALLAVSFQTSEPRAEAYTASSLIAGDSATVGFYLGKSAGQMGLDSFIKSDASFGSCTIQYSYGGIQVNSERAALVEEKYCKWFM